jgi:hypothetical protein
MRIADIALTDVDSDAVRGAAVLACRLVTETLPDQAGRFRRGASHSCTGAPEWGVLGVVLRSGREALPAKVEQAALQGGRHGGGAVVDAELGKASHQVRLHRGLADP